MKRMFKVLVLTIVTIIGVIGLTACKADDGKLKIAILSPNPTHDWAGSVGYAAQDKADEINKAGVYTAKVLTAAAAANQITQIEDITANRNYDAVVILPMDNTVGTALKALVATGIPVVQFDRLISEVEDKVVSSVMGDNEGIGYETGKRFLAKGLTKDDQILLLSGDLSSVPTMRTNGFKKALTEAGWTDAEIKGAIKDLGSTGWQRSKGETLFTDWLTAASDAEIEKTKWIFTHDDPVAMGIFDAFTKSTITPEKQAKFLGDKRVSLASSAGAAENYRVLAGTHADAKINATFDKLADYFSVSYTPYMMKDAIQVMVDKLDGKKVDNSIVIKSSVVDSTNVNKFTGFGE